MCNLKKRCDFQFLILTTYESKLDDKDLRTRTPFTVFVVCVLFLTFAKSVSSNFKLAACGFASTEFCFCQNYLTIDLNSLSFKSTSYV